MNKILQRLVAVIMLVAVLVAIPVNVYADGYSGIGGSNGSTKPLNGSTLWYYASEGAQGVRLSVVKNDTMSTVLKMDVLNDLAFKKVDESSNVIYGKKTKLEYIQSSSSVGGASIGIGSGYGGYIKGSSYGLQVPQVFGTKGSDHSKLKNFVYDTANNVLKPNIKTLLNISDEDWNNGKYTVLAEPIAVCKVSNVPASLTATEWAIYCKAQEDAGIPASSSNSVPYQIGVVTNNNCPKSAYLDGPDSWVDASGKTNPVCSFIKNPTSVPSSRIKDTQLQYRYFGVLAVFNTDPVTIDPPPPDGEEPEPPTSTDDHRITETLEYKHTLVYVKPGVGAPLVDTRGNDAQWHWDNPKGSQEIEYESKWEQWSYNHNLQAIEATICKQTLYHQYYKSCNGCECGGYQQRHRDVWYWTDDEGKRHKEVDVWYTTEYHSPDGTENSDSRSCGYCTQGGWHYHPELDRYEYNYFIIGQDSDRINVRWNDFPNQPTYDLVKPLDVRTETTMTDADALNLLNMVGYGSIVGTVDNNIHNTAKTYPDGLPTLDTNEVSKWSFTLGANLGIPVSFPGAPLGTVTSSNSKTYRASGAYVEGESYYCPPSMLAAWFGKVGGMNLSSLQEGDGPEQVNFSSTKNASYDGGTFYMRNVKTGMYQLGADGAWYADFDGVAYTNYGSHYYTKVVLGGSGPEISKPVFSAKQLGPGQGGWKNEDQWVSERWGSWSQPVIYCKWVSKTVGGYMDH